jgi:superfamily II DNA or RNA helicase
MENYRKGIMYEDDTKMDLIAQGHTKVFLWRDIPMSVFKESAIFNCYEDKLKFRKKSQQEEGIEDDDKKHGVSDTGCDIFYFNEEQKEWIIAQCKNYTNTITLSKLAGFYDIMLATGLKGELYYTSKLSEPVTRYTKDRVKFIRRPYVNKVEKKKPYVKLKPRDYQTEAYTSLKDKKRSILHLPCGMGKTLIAIMWAKQFDLVIIFSPLKPHASQNLSRFKNEIDDYDKYMLIDSDGVRDVKEIKRHLGKKIVLSVTYKSHDVIGELMQFIPEGKSVGIVVDEFHNLTYDNVMNKDDSFYKVFAGNYNYLFVSATPRLFDSEEDDYVDNLDITGKVEYSYEFGKAIQNGYICDYDVYVPDISIKNEDQLKDVYKELKITNLENVGYDVKAHFLLRCLEEHGHSKCICYSKDIDDAKKLMESFERVKKYHMIDLYVGLIVADTTQNQREKILKEFSETNMKALICSVRILDECIDIPKCDSVFMTSKQTNKLRTIQRLCRSNRKDKGNPSKKSGIYVWSDEYEELTEIIASLKEFDSTFTKEKIKICNINNNKKLCIKSRKYEDDEKQYEELDKIVIKSTKVESWNNMLGMTDKYISEYDIKPLISSADPKIRRMATWLSNQIRYAKERTFRMKSDTIYQKFIAFIERYKHLFLNNEEQWIDTCNKVDKYMNINKCKPTDSSNDVEVKRLSRWLTLQFHNAKKRTQIMQYDHIYKMWNDLVNKYIDLFRTGQDEWKFMFGKADDYIEEHKKKPSPTSKNPDIRKLGRWIDVQQQNFKKKKGIMQSNDIYNKWKEFVEKYKDLFQTHQERWHSIFNNVKQYIITNKYKPCETSDDPDEKVMGKWIQNQQNNFRNGHGLMKLKPIYNLWKEFIEEFKNYFRILIKPKKILFESEEDLSESEKSNNITDDQFSDNKISESNLNIRTKQKYPNINRFSKSKKSNNAIDYKFSDDELSESECPKSKSIKSIRQKISNTNKYTTSNNVIDNESADDELSESECSKSIKSTKKLFTKGKKKKN